MKKVSIIIPVYNAQRYLRKCLNSVINQTYENLEIICINDGSKDISGEILEEYKNKDLRIIVINKENGGVSSARNKGLKVCTGEYVMFLDSDDFLALDTISFCIELIERTGVEIVRFNFKKKYSKIVTKRNMKYFEDDKILKYPYEDIVKQIYKNDKFCSACETMIKKEIAKRHYFRNDISIGEDFLYFIECLFDSQKIYVSNSYKYYYILNKKSITTCFDDEKYIKSIKGLIIVINKINQILSFNSINLIDKSEKIKRNISDYFNLCYQRGGILGVEKLKELIKNDQNLLKDLNLLEIDINKLCTFKLSKKIKLLIKKQIKKLL